MYESPISIVDKARCLLNLKTAQQAYMYVEFLFRFNIIIEYPEHKACIDYALESPDKIPAGSCYQDIIYKPNNVRLVFARQRLISRV